MIKRTNILFFSFLIYFITACGGGGSGDSSGGSSSSSSSSGNSSSGGKSTEIIPSERRIDWSPGVPGGIPDITTICANVKDAPYNAVGNGIEDDTNAIQSAIDNCPAGQVVYIPEGDYRTSSMLSVFEKPVILRGAGPDRTRILNYDNSNDGVIVLNRWANYRTPISIISSFEKGTNTITVENASTLAVNDYIVISQLNDPSLVTITGNNGDCTWCGENGERTMAQIVQIIGIAGNSLTLSRPLYFSLSTVLNPDVRKSDMIEGAGIEDLYIEQIDAVSGVDESNNISLGRCVKCWVKNVESRMTSNHHVNLRGCYKSEIRDSYFRDGYNYFGGDGYGVLLQGWNSDNLVENNIIYHTRHAMSFEGGSGNVYGYNFADEGLDENSPNWLTHDAMTHGAHPYMNLWEGNSHDKIGLDNIWGSSSHNTFFRNFVDRNTSRVAASSWAWVVDIEANNYYENLVGNVLCHEGCAGTYDFTYEDGVGGSRISIYKIGYYSPGDSSGPDDPMVEATLLRHGNYDYITQSTIWDPDIDSRDLPDSYYLTEKPVWFGDVAWPPIGPDVPGYVNAIPAELRFR